MPKCTYVLTVFLFTFALTLTISLSLSLLKAPHIQQLEQFMAGNFSRETNGKYFALVEEHCEKMKMKLKRKKKEEEEKEDSDDDDDDNSELVFERKNHREPPDVINPVSYTHLTLPTKA